MSSRRKLIPVVLVLLCSAVMVQAQGATGGSAEPSPAQQHHNAALQQAERAIDEHGYAPSRLLALGRAQLAQGALGPAIVSFERGLLLAPRDPALRQALTAARARAGLGEPGEVSWPERIEHAVSLREWSLAAFACSVATALTLLGVSLTKRRKRLCRAGLVVSTLALALTAGATYAAQRQLKVAYVLREDSALRRSPFASATVLSRLRPGEAVTPHAEHADYVYVESERGQAGWISKAELAQLSAGPSSET